MESGQHSLEKIGIFRPWENSANDPNKSRTSLPSNEMRVAPPSHNHRLRKRSVESCASSSPCKAPTCKEGKCTTKEPFCLSFVSREMQQLKYFPITDSRAFHTDLYFPFLSDSTVGVMFRQDTQDIYRKHWDQCCFSDSPALRDCLPNHRSRRRIKEDKKPFNCTICHSLFSNKGQLKGHLRIHTGERPFVCPQCLKTFTRNEELTRHKRIHSGIRPFTCENCGKSFGRKDHLKKHSRIHDRFRNVSDQNNQLNSAAVYLTRQEQSYLFSPDML